MANCYNCGVETEKNCLWCNKPACKDHLIYVEGADICKPCYKTTPEYQEEKMRKVEQKMKKKRKKSVLK